MTSNKPPLSESEAVTHGIRVRVKSDFVQDRSDAAARRYVFTYTVTITNESSRTVQLRTRHWVITDGFGKVEEVRGPGVVGEEPVLRPGAGFQYTSGAVLQTERGMMRGSYQPQLEDGARFDAEIAPFALERPYSLN